MSPVTPRVAPWIGPITSCGPLMTLHPKVRRPALPGSHRARIGPARVVGWLEFVLWTPDRHLRHSLFVVLGENQLVLSSGLRNFFRVSARSTWD
jgi:hypothetical protein